MNSAEKKAPEPSMDDIISSIRNIIADDARETAPAQTAPAVETSAPAIVQLTENQIAEPAIEQANGVSATPDAMASAPAAEVITEPAVAPSTPDQEIASEIDAVPGLAATSEAPAATLEPIAPALNISEPLSPASELESAPANDVMAASAPTVAPAAPDIMAAPAPESAIAAAPVPPEVNAQMPAAIIEDDIAFVSPEVTQNSLADPSLTSVAPSLTPTNDPVEEMMQSVRADQTEGDLVNNGVDPDQILEGMDSSAAEVAPSTPVEAAPVVKEPGIAPAKGEEVVAEEAPIVLDASQVTPEDAVAITAVANATTQALSGTSLAKPTAITTQNQSGRSLEESVKAMLKPMIKEWLDENMPRILAGVIKEEVALPDSDKN